MAGLAVAGPSILLTAPLGLPGMPLTEKGVE